MPSVTLYTNLKRQELAADFMPRLAAALVQILSLKPDNVHWILHPDTTMSMGSDNAGIKYLQVHVEAWQKFDSADRTSTAVPLISDFLAKETGLEKEQIHVVLHSIDLWRIGKNGQIIQ